MSYPASPAPGKHDDAPPSSVRNLAGFAASAQAEDLRVDDVVRAGGIHTLERPTR